MSTTASLPSYNEITTALNAAPTHYNASQLHGLMCGLICATGGEVNTAFEKGFLGDIKDESAREILQRLYEMSYHQMSEFSFEFSLLLPDDKLAITERTEALGLWCQGFLTGLEQSNVPIQDREPSEVTEAIDDIIEISQVNFDDTDTTDEDETSYYELIEYVRLAVLMIFQDINNSQPEITINNDGNVLH